MNNKDLTDTLFSATHGTFSRTDHNLGHQANLNKYKKPEIIPSVLMDHNKMPLGGSYQKKAEEELNLIHSLVIPGHNSSSFSDFCHSDSMSPITHAWLCDFLFLR